MNTPSQPAERITLERTYTATVDQLWELWTTKAGFEAWWGPEGFRVEVHQIEPRQGGKLVYDMIADGAEQIAFMKAQNMALSHGVVSRFSEIKDRESLELTSLIDFIDGAKPYEVRANVSFHAHGDQVKMTIVLDPHHTPEWTARAQAGWESQLTKLPGALQRRK